MLKTHPNPQGPNVLANEWMGSALARGLGVPAPEFAQIQLDVSTIGRLESLTVETVSGRVTPTAGIHFGSKMVGDTCGRRRPHSFLTMQQRASVYHSEGGLTMWLLDLWADHQDWRDAVFVRGDDSEPDTLIYIDHGHLFGGPLWLPAQADSLRSAHHHIDGGQWTKGCIETAVEDFQDRVPALLEKAIATLPRTWYTGDLESLLGSFSRRLQNLKGLALGTIDSTHP